MIVSQIVALCGFHAAPHFRQAMPHLVAAHIACYMVNLLQEIFDVHRQARMVQSINNKLAVPPSEALAAVKKVQ